MKRVIGGKFVLSGIPAVLIMILLCQFFQGCVPNRGEYEKRVLAHDPSYQKIIDKRNSIKKELNDQKADFSRKKEKIENEISALKNERVRIGKEYALQIEKIKRQLQPEKRRLSRELLELKRQYKRKTSELRETARDIKEINALITKKDALSLTPEETRTWDDRLASLGRKKENMCREKGKLEVEVEILELKIKVLGI